MRCRTRSLLVAFVSIASALPACGRGARVERYPAAGDGRLTARLGGTRLLQSAAQATFCRGDSVLVIMAVTDRWIAGLALRGAFPVETAREYSVSGALGGPGTATAAFRAMTDSVERALVGVGGTARLDVGRQATGRFDVLVPAPDGHSPPRRILGAFKALPTADTAAICRITPRTP